MTFDEALSALRAQHRKLTEPLAGIVSLAADIVDRGLSDARKTKRLREELRAASANVVAKATAFEATPAGPLAEQLWEEYCESLTRDSAARTAMLNHLLRSP